jgi:hypothetical protein
LVTFGSKTPGILIGRLLLPALHHVAREGFILAHGNDLFYLQVVSQRKAGHQDLVDLVVGIHIKQHYDPPLPADLVGGDDLTGFHGLQRGFRLLLPDVP